MYIFDINGTVTEHGCIIEYEVYNHMKNFLQKHSGVFVSGVDYSTVEKKIGDLVYYADAIYTLSGNEKWLGGECKYKRVVRFDKSDVDWVKSEFGCYLEYTFDAYLTVDVSSKTLEEKRIMCDRIEETIPYLLPCIASNPNYIAIYMNGSDKRQILRDFSNPIYVTDTVEKYSYDYRIAQEVKTIHVTGPKHLTEISAAW